MRRFVTIGASAGLLLAVTVITAGTASSSTDVRPAINLRTVALAAAKAHAAASAIPVSGKEFSFKLGTRSVGRPGKVTFSFKNTGHVQHDFKIDGKQTPRISPGKTARLTVTFKKKGTYSYQCTVPGHAAAGMKGVFTVR
jgi:uncharacterized cupredoxin-like copper-binding protein